MSFLEALRTGWWELWTHPVRSFLTMLGVVLGVSAVIAILAVGEGARREALMELSQVGEPAIFIRQEKEELSNRGVRQRTPLSLQDWWYLRQGLDHLFTADTAVLEMGRFPVYWEQQKAVATVVGVERGFPEAMAVPLQRGRDFTEEDVASARPVCILGHGIKRRLFGALDALGKVIRIQHFLCTVVGVLEPKDVSLVSFMSVRDVENDIFVPYTLVLAQRGQRLAFPAEELVFQVRPPYSVTAVAGLLEARLQRLRPEIRYRLLIPVALLRQKQAVQRIFTIVMTFIAAISLVVGGIGIMNIMLAVVVQRTREIGIRRAIGATQWDILLQFLVETLVLCFVGALFGILLGVLTGKAITRFAGWSTVFSPSVMLLAVAVALATGLLFGAYPAYLAARLHPVEALRYE